MILSIGEILVDIFDDGTSKTVFPGGAPFNVACNIAHFNNKEVSFYGAVGQDEYGKFLNSYASNKMNHLKIDSLSDYHTTEAIVTLVNGERSFRFNRTHGADYHLSLDELKKFDLSKVNIVHLGSLMLSEQDGRDFFKEALSYLRLFKHIKISFDVNYRDDIFSSPIEAKNIFLDALKEANIIKFTSEELELLTSKKDIQESLDFLLRKNQLAVVTLGEKGSVYYQNGHLVEAKTYQMKPVDTTGAGDAFYSYFLYALDKGFDQNNDQAIKEVLYQANLVGGFATQKKGAIDVVPSLEELENFIQKIQ